jgi:hypothetical protein
MLRVVAVLALAVTSAACGGATSTPSSLPTPSPSRSPTPVEAAIAKICAPPAFATCQAEMEQFFDGWTTDKLHGQFVRCLRRRPKGRDRGVDRRQESSSA